MQDTQPLREAERELGAVFDGAGGDTAPLHFGNPRAEYQAARSRAAVFDLADRAQLELTGRDRAKFLHNFCTNDVRALTTSTGCEAFLTNVQGKVLAHVSVFATPDSLELDSVPGSSDRIIAHLSRYQISEDVEFKDRTAERGMLFVTGPEARAALARAGLEDGTLAPLQHVALKFASGTVQIRRQDWLGTAGYAVVAAREQLPDLMKTLANYGAQPAGTVAWDPLRIEAATPLYGQDITDANLAQEVHRTEQCISFRKGCYLGQEPIARIDALGHVNQELYGIRFAAGPVPLPGAEVFPAEASEKAIGRVTSAALSYDGDVPVALAYIRRPFNVRGGRVKVRVGDGFAAGVLFWPER